VLTDRLLLEPLENGEQDRRCGFVGVTGGFLVQ
jgi:hypothetical protein